MIYDSINNIDRYAAVHPRFREAFAFLKELAAKNPPSGRYYPNGRENDEIYANVSSYSTSPLSEREFEAHRRYIDLQYLSGGREMVFFPSATAEPTEVTVPYSGETDAEKRRLANAEECVRIPLCAGTFAIIFPPEPHAPCVAFGSPETVQKIVLKIKMD